MPLHKRSGSHFQPRDRQLGNEAFRAGRVHLELDGHRARARVGGARGKTLAVGLDWSQVAAKRTLHAFCECPRFAGGKSCEHLWAALLALAETGPQNQPPGRDRLALRKDRAASWGDLDLGQAAPRTHHAVASGPQRGERMRHQQARPGRGWNRASRKRSAKGHVAGPGSWQAHLAAVAAEAARLTAGRRSTPPGEVRWLINTAVSLSTGGLVVDAFSQRSGAKGKPGPLRRLDIVPEELEALLLVADPASEPSLALITALPTDPPGRQTRGRQRPPKISPGRTQRLQLPPLLYERTLPRLCAAGALGWWDGHSLPAEPQLLSWDSGPIWHLVLELEIVVGGVVRLRGRLERDGVRVPLKEPILILPDGAAPDDAAGDAADSDGEEGGSALVVFKDAIAHLEATPGRDLPWIALLRRHSEVTIPKQDLDEALTSLLELPDLPRLEAPEELRLSEESSTMEPRLVLEPAGPAWVEPQLLAELSFVYGESRVDAGDPRPAIVNWPARSFLRRDMEGEHRALVRLLELGLHPVASHEGHQLELSPHELPAVAEPLLAEGWEVEAHGTSLRSPSSPALRVESGIDWFELRGSVDFAGDRVELAKVLEAISSGRRFVKLDDGSEGILPEAWIKACDSLNKLAHSSSDDGLRFLPSQALLVDALLTAMPRTNVDRAFSNLRKKLSSFDRIKPKKEPRGFVGTLRGYQRQGLGWLDFLRQFSLGGVLADDMGLGKTVQVLALIKAYRTPSKTTKLPFLVVAPRSLVYNWIEEAARFTPKVSTLEYSGPNREALRPTLMEYDMVVTTYGTMRRDIAYLATVEFDTVILDEAQAIKNPSSQTAKASVLLGARHRLALTGTPIENHLGELGSLFEFLNPGLLGRLPRLEALASGRAPSEQELKVIAEGLRPFILRRTKAEVLPDLPPKTEQVLHCTLRPRQRELYDQLRAAYQQSLLEQVESKGVSGSAIQVLQALLRLRQVACHPGLVDDEWEDAGSAKLEALFEQVSEVLDEGHKVIVFSQFTKLLGFVRRHLDAEETPYAYLDGQTRKRGQLVERFQTDPECNLFLISLKAGGLGLNLTAAEYVFLLDPWWNPAVEAQAIDRAHRIGQTQPVFAYRLIARDTVEEKIVELQRAKRHLADTVLEGEGQSLRDLTADDLRMLLS